MIITVFFVYHMFLNIDLGIKKCPTENGKQKNKFLEHDE